jgi:hypothetical protein
MAGIFAWRSRASLLSRDDRMLTDASADTHIDEMSPSRDQRHRVGDAPESVITGISALQLRALADQRQKS